MAKSYMLSEDAGGTMTDAFLMDEEGHFVIGKAPTMRQDESASFMEAASDAARFWELKLGDLMPNLKGAIYSGTGMLNILLTLTGSKVGVIVNKGFEDYLLHQRGLNWAEYGYEDRLHSVTHQTPPELVPKRLVKGVTERINMFGAEVIPLYEEEVRRAARELMEEGVEAIGISFVFSYLNPSHELRAMEIVAEVAREFGREIPINIGSALAPITREHCRLNSVVIQCYAAEPLKKQLIRIEEKAKEDGYRHELLTLAGYGGLINIRHPRLFESVTSGPIGGLIGAKRISDHLGLPNLVAMDMGGTSFDVSIITKGILPVHRDTLIARYNLNLPTLSIQSIGAGAGMVIRIDPVSRRVTLGPESAGADVGICYRYNEPTVSDCNLILGYLNPDYFLGGKIKLDKERALEVFKERVADPLRLDPHGAASDIVELINVRMREHVRATMRGSGFDPADYHVAIYGGAGPLHLWGIVEGVPFKGVITFPFAAAFSAFGIANCDYVHRYHKGAFVVIPPGADEQTKLYMGQIINSTYETLENAAKEELTKEGYAPEVITLRHLLYGRYLGQLEDVEAPSPVSRVASAADMDRMTGAFEDAYGAKYPLAAKSPEFGFQITELAVEGHVPTVKPKLVKHPLESSAPPKEAHKGRRRVYHKKNWMEFDLWEMDLLKAGNEVKGPAIIEHPMTTLPVPPGHSVRFDEYRVIWWR
jgi:acetone carboxylase beta subunit